MKKFLSFILAAIILACPLCSFATNAAETMDWYFCDEEYLNECEPWIYTFGGETALGENEITFDGVNFCTYFTFNAEASGYYYVECNDAEIDWLGFPESVKNGSAYREATSCYISEDDINKDFIFRLDAGETYLGVDFLYFADPEDKYNISIEYIGEEITDINFEDGTFENLILYYDLYDGDISEISADFEVIFSSGKSVELKEKYIYLHTENYEWVKGENNATVSFMDFEKEVVVTAFEISDFIADVNFTNYDDYKNIKREFSDYYYSDDIYGAKLIFTLASGEMVEINTGYDETIEINGRDYWLYVFYNHINSEETEIVVYVGGYAIKTYECNTEKSTLAEGARLLGSRVGENIKNASYNLRLAISEIFTVYDENYFEEAIQDSIYYFENAVINLSDIVFLFDLFFDFYFG